MSLADEIYNKYYDKVFKGTMFYYVISAIESRWDTNNLKYKIVLIMNRYRINEPSFKVSEFDLEIFEKMIQDKIIKEVIDIPDFIKTNQHLNINSCNCSGYDLLHYGHKCNKF